MENIIIFVAVILISAIIGFGVAYYIVTKIVTPKKKEQILKNAEQEGENIKKEKIFQAKEKFLQMKASHEQFVAEKNNQLQQTENKLKQRELVLNQQNQELQKKQKEILMLSCCGTDCSACYCYGEMCKGCNEHKGKVFHAPEGKACPIYECAKNKSCLYSCRECAKIPCEIWYKTRDPKFSDEEFQKDVEERVQRLRRTIK